MSCSVFMIIVCINKPCHEIVIHSLNSVEKKYVQQYLGYNWKCWLPLIASWFALKNIYYKLKIHWIMANVVSGYWELQF